MMENMKNLYDILKQLSILHEGLLEIEREKYDAMIEDNAGKLDKIMTQEQVFYLKVKGLEQKREKLIEAMGMKGKSLRDVIDNAVGEDRENLIKIQQKLLSILPRVKKINEQCQVLTEIRLHRIDMAIDKLDEKEKKKIYSDKGESGNNKKTTIVSKRI